jgi:protein TonB
MTDLRVATLVMAHAVAFSVGAAESSRPPTDQRKIEELELEQRRMHRGVKEKLESIPDGPRKEELKRLLAEIESRLNAQGTGKVYLSPGAKLTPGMRLYHGKLVRKIEDCGTRHLPTRGGKTVYGHGLAAVTIDKAGQVLDVEIVESSRDKLVDSHMQRVVRSSSPFGPLPDKLTSESSRPFRSAVILTRFDFRSDGDPMDALPESERCKWK